MNLSKSKYLKCAQCLKAAWMLEHMPGQFDVTTLNESVLRTGQEVGKLARKLFGDPAVVTFSERGISGMIEDTKALVESGAPVICEAAFAHDGKMCLVDILKVDDDGAEIIEVKASTSVKDVHLKDVAFQMWVLERCGMNVKRVSIMHLDNTYIRGEDLDLAQLFCIEDVTWIVRNMQPGVEKLVMDAAIIASDPAEPNIGIGPQCGKPYECGFKKWCWRNVPHPSIFDIPRIGDVAFKYYDAGIATFKDLVATDAIWTFGVNAQNQVLSEVESWAETVIDYDRLEAFIRSLRYPLAFLDFETIMPAVPLFPGTRAYQQIPTQYSLHIRVSEDAELEHREFLAEEGKDPRRELAERLIADIPADACVLTWNMAFECKRIEELAEAFPDLASKLMDIHDNIRDLMSPFQLGYYYKKEMEGSYSIKKVLPALCPKDPELDYGALDGIHNGAEASDAYMRLKNALPEERSRIRRQLLEYCQLDTLAEVKILEKLEELLE